MVSATVFVGTMSGSFFFTEIALSELRPFSVILVRVVIAAILLNLIVVALGHRMPTSPKLWRMFFVIGVFNNFLPFSLIVWAQTQIPSSLAAILSSTTPISTVILAHFLTTDEKLTPNRLGGVLVALVGVVVMVGMDALNGLGANVLAQVAILGATLSYACAGIYGKRFKGTPFVVTATGQITCTAVMTLPITLLVDQPWLGPMPSLTVWGALISLALLSTAFSPAIHHWGNERSACHIPDSGQCDLVGHHVSERTASSQPDGGDGVDWTGADGD